MPRNKILTEYEKGRIQQGFEEGRSQRDIAMIIGRSQKVISNYLRNKEGYGNNRKGGRPIVNDDRSLRNLRRAARCHKGKTALQLKEISGARGVKSTITRALNAKCGLRNKRRTAILRLSKQNKLNRIVLAKKYIQSFANENIIWSDEKRFCFKGPDGHYKAWISKDESFEVCKDRFSPGVHVWAAFLNDNIIGPYFLNKKQTFTSTKLFLCYFLTYYIYLQIHRNIRRDCSAIFKWNYWPIANFSAR